MGDKAYLIVIYNIQVISFNQLIYKYSLKPNNALTLSDECFTFNCVDTSNTTKCIWLSISKFNN